MTKLDSILKSRDITLSTKVRLVKAMVFLAVMYGCESWTIKKAEHQSIDAFELWCWRRLFRVPWTARRSNQSILKEISPGCSLEGMILKLKLQYFGHLMWRADLFEKTLTKNKQQKKWKDPDAGKDWGQDEKGMTEDEMVGWLHQLDGHGSGWTPGVGDGQGGLVCCGSWGHKESDMTERLNWTEFMSVCSQNWSQIYVSRLNSSELWPLHRIMQLTSALSHLPQQPESPALFTINWEITGNSSPSSCSTSASFTSYPIR